MFFIWIDCEMTGLDCEKDHILEIACIITDSNMKILAQYHSIIKQSNIILKNVNLWSKLVHGYSGLLDRVSKSEKTYKIVQSDILNLLKNYTSEKNTYIAGNSVYTDLYFIKKRLPKVFYWLHYRIFDISTFKLLAIQKNIPVFIKNNNHNAIEDIKESMAEYEYYKNIIFK
jgi:oligoribonuclease